jgi:hypothetical protein
LRELNSSGVQEFNKTDITKMNKVSRILLICVSSAFALCCAGLVGGFIYTLVEYFMNGRALERILGGSIPFYKAIGALGILGFVLFFLFLLSLLSGQSKHDKP